MEDLVDFIDRRTKEFADKLGLHLMTDEEWEEYKAKQKRAPVTGTITFLKGDSAKKAAAMFKNRKN